jgi:hypothetical protein
VHVVKSSLINDKTLVDLLHVNEFKQTNGYKCLTLAFSFCIHMLSFKQPSLFT